MLFKDIFTKLKRILFPVADLATQQTIINRTSQSLKDAIEARTGLSGEIIADLVYSKGFKFKIAGNTYTVEFISNNTNQPVRIITRKMVRINPELEETKFVHISELDFACDLSSGVSFIFSKEPKWPITSFDATFLTQLLDFTDNYPV